MSFLNNVNTQQRAHLDSGEKPTVYLFKGNKEARKENSVQRQCVLGSEVTRLLANVAFAVNSGINAVRYSLYNYMESEMETDRQGRDLAF